jgi:hypothetical protein
MGNERLETKAPQRKSSLVGVSWTIIVLVALTMLAIYIFTPVQRPLHRRQLSNGIVLELCSVSAKAAFFRYDRRSRALAWLERLEYRTGFRLPSGGRAKMVTFAGLSKDCGLILRSDAPLVESQWDFQVRSADQTTVPIQTMLNYRRQFHLISIPSLPMASKRLTLQCRFRDGSAHEDIAFDFENPNLSTVP